MTPMEQAQVRELAFKLAHQLLNTSKLEDLFIEANKIYGYLTTGKWIKE